LLRCSEFMHGCCLISSELTLAWWEPPAAHRLEIFVAIVSRSELCWTSGRED
jgi:hypothetical protein